jgi:hypothetical protein
VPFPAVPPGIIQNECLLGDRAPCPAFALSAPPERFFVKDFGFVKG